MGPLSDPFEDEEVLRDALEEVAEASAGSYVEEPWGSVALAAARAVAEGAAPALAPLARDAVDRVFASSELRDLADDEQGWLLELDVLRRQLA